MKIVRVGQLRQLMPYVKTAKFSRNVFVIRGVYHDPILNEDEPFCITKSLSELSGSEFDEVMNLVLPSGHPVFEVFAKVRAYYGEMENPALFPAEKREKHFAINDNHYRCKNYGGFCNYCHKKHAIIADVELCEHYETSELKKGGDVDV